MESVSLLSSGQPFMYRRIVTMLATPEPMRRCALWLAGLSMLVAACAPQEYHADTPAQYQSAAGCAQVNRDNLYAAAGYANAYLTVPPASRRSRPGGKGASPTSTPSGR